MWEGLVPRIMLRIGKFPPKQKTLPATAILRKNNPGLHIPAQPLTNHPEHIRPNLHPLINQIHLHPSIIPQPNLLNQSNQNKHILHATLLKRIV
jgi:hypothetical protein